MQSWEDVKIIRQTLEEKENIATRGKGNYIRGRSVGSSEGISELASRYFVNSVLVLKLKPSTGFPSVRDAWSCFLT